MRKIKLMAFLSVFVLLCSTGCTKQQDKFISLEDAKNSVLTMDSTAIISECDLDIDDKIYEIDFSNAEGSFEAFVNAITGEVLSVTKETASEDVIISENIDASKALSIALEDSGLPSDVMVLENEYEASSDSYEIVLKDGNKEYEYKISAKDGKILSSEIELDS